jgi:hypothetical protein
MGIRGIGIVSFYTVFAHMEPMPASNGLDGDFLAGEGVIIGPVRIRRIGVCYWSRVMSISALEALQVIELLDKHDRPVDISAIDPTTLQKKLEYYRSDRLRRGQSDAATASVAGANFAALVSSVSSRNSLVALLPSGCVYSRLYVDDPLCKIARPSSESAGALNECLGMNSKNLPERESVERGMQYFASIAPLIRCGVITVLPLNELHEPPEQTPIYYSEDAFRSQIPSHLHDFIHRSARIGEVIPAPEKGGLLITQTPPRSPTRGISIRFANDGPSRRSPIYMLMETQIAEKDELEGGITMIQKLDWDNPPTEQSFNIWTYQSINRAIIARLESVARELSLAEQLQATYQTESQFEAELCGMSCEEQSAAESGTAAVNFLNANAPYLRIESAEQLARLRMDNPKLFERWQQSLLGVAIELNGCSRDFEIKAKKLFESEIRPQVDELTRALLEIKARCVGASLVTASVLGLALLSNSALPFGAALGYGALSVAGQTLPSIAEYLAKKRGPVFIWNKLIDNN